LHVTMRFFGDVDEPLRERVERRIVKAVAGLAPFPFRLGCPGAFPSMRAARVLWFGVGEGEGAVRDLARGVEEAIDGLGFKREKRFHAHITVGRTKGRLSERFRERFLSALPEPVEVRADALHLMKSTLTPQGAIYEVLRSFPLGS